MRLRSRSCSAKKNGGCGDPINLVLARSRFLSARWLRATRHSGRPASSESKLNLESISERAAVAEARTRMPSMDFPTVIKFVIHAHPAQGGMRGLETVQGNYSWVAVTAKRPPEKRLGGGDVAGTADVGFDGFALFIHGAVQ